MKPRIGEGFGADLWRLRHAAGLTRTRAAEILGISESQYGAWERGDWTPSKATIRGSLFLLEEERPPRRWGI